MKQLLRWYMPPSWLPPGLGTPTLASNWVLELNGLKARGTRARGAGGQSGWDSLGMVCGALEPVGPGGWGSGRLGTRRVGGSGSPEGWEPEGTLGEMKNISFIHYYREFGGNMGTKRSEILQGSQYFWFGALFFSQNWVNFKKHSKLAKNVEKQPFFSGFSKFVQFWLKNSAPNQNNWLPWRISLLLVPILPPNSR